MGLNDRNPQLQDVYWEPIKQKYLKRVGNPNDPHLS